MQTSIGSDGSDGRRTVIFVGHARLPHSLVSPGSPAVVSLEVEADMESQQVVGIGARGMLPCAEELVRRLLTGRPLEDGIDDVLTGLQARYVGPCQRAISSAIANAYDAYLRYRQQVGRSREASSSSKTATPMSPASTPLTARPPA